MSRRARVGGNVPKLPAGWYVWGDELVPHNAMLDNQRGLGAALVSFRSIAAAPENPAGLPKGWYANNRANGPYEFNIPIPPGFLRDRTGVRMRTAIQLQQPRDTSTQSAVALQSALAADLRGLMLSQGG